jgi:hypothetical protein
VLFYRLVDKAPDQGWAARLLLGRKQQMHIVSAFRLALSDNTMSKNKIIFNNLQN